MGSTAANLAPRERLIVALDVPSADDAMSIVGRLSGRVGAFKVGLQLFTAAGPDLVRRICGDGHRVFLDLKFHDIPNTVAMAAAEAAKCGVWMFNVHAAGGAEMMRRAAESAANVGAEPRPLVIAVTVLTSSDADVLAATGIADTVEDQVLRLARLAHASGMDGIVASAREAALIREHFPGREMIIVTPGIRLLNATFDDQKRVTTFADALRSGADHVVVGRPITRSDDMVLAVEELVREVEEI
ncbi:MAG: orotidine-5'-phosphate decarboxylase [Acidobacteria bacterium]|nr:orotidine-5'-phosphate decarboxylase [Acidobacteriota bacterium]